MPVPLLARDLKPVGHSYELGKRPSTKLLHHVVSMHFDCDLAYADFCSDLLVHEAGAHPAHDVLFAWAEGLKTGAKIKRRLEVSALCAVAVKGDINCVQQILFTYGFCEELNRSRLHGLDGHRDIAVAGNEDDGHFYLRLGQLKLKVETAQARQAHVQYQATDLVCNFGGQKICGCHERYALQTD